MICFSRAISLFLFFGLIASVFQVVDPSYSFKSIVKQISRLPRKVGQFFGIKESCSEQWIRTNKDDLELLLARKLFGQPVVHSEIPEIFSTHWKSLQGSNHLLICFYGTPGTGKTYTTKLLNNYIFTQGRESYYYLFYSGGDSYTSPEGLRILKDDMTESIQYTIDECPYSIIVFDEVDKYPKGFLDNVIMPFIRSSTGKASFIFITNIGSNKLMEKSLEIEQSYFRSHNLGNYNNVKDALLLSASDPFYSSELVKRGHVKHFIPFLPHKEESFTECLKEALLEFRNHNTEPLKSTIIRAVLKDVQLIPASYPLYISSGCKRLQSYILTAINKLKIRFGQLSKTRPDEL